MDSHKHLPKLLLIPFSYKHPMLNKNDETGEEHKNMEKVCDVFDCKSELIHREKIKDLGVEKGYYSDEIESFFNKYVEDEFTKIRDKLKSASNTIGFTGKDLVCVRMFFLFSVLRCPQYKTDLEKVITNKVNVLHRPMQEVILGAMEPIYDRLNKQLNLNDRVLKAAAIDSPKREFVIPQNVFYLYSNQHFGNAIVFPVHKKKAVLMVEREYENRIPDLLHLTSDEEVDSFNRSAYLTERATDNLFIVGSKNELERFQAKEYEYKRIFAYLRECKT